MDKVLDDIGLATKPLELVEAVIIVENMTIRSAKLTVATLLKDGRHFIDHRKHENG
jgi:hypothetical protein